MSTIQKAGFVLIQRKSVLQPAKCVKWLGFEINLEKGCILVPKEKIAKLKESLAHACTAKCLPARKIAGITGKIISLGLAIGPVSRIRTRALYTLLALRQSWCSVLELNEDVRGEIQFWLANLQCYNGQPIWRTPPQCEWSGP